MATTHYKGENNSYAADYIRSGDYTAAVGGGKKNIKRRYKGGMPASFRGFAGCANWAGGALKRKSRRLRRKSMKGGIQRSSSSLVHPDISVGYTRHLAGGKRRRTRKNKKSRRH
jgi:hypothetical protein